MDKVLVEIVCPATSKQYDFWISKKMKVNSVIEKVAVDIMQFELNNSLFDLQKMIVLYFYENRTLLCPERTIEESGVSSGCRLMII